MEEEINKFEQPTDSEMQMAFEDMVARLQNESILLTKDELDKPIKLLKDWQHPFGRLKKKGSYIVADEELKKELKKGKFIK